MCQGEKLQFVFRNLDHRDPESAYTFILMINDEGVYQSMYNYNGFMDSYLSVKADSQNISTI